MYQLRIVKEKKHHSSQVKITSRRDLRLLSHILKKRNESCLSNNTYESNIAEFAKNIKIKQIHRQKTGNSRNNTLINICCLGVLSVITKVKQR